MGESTVWADFILDSLLVIQRQIEAVIWKTPPERWKQGIRGDVVLIPGFGQKWVFLRTIADHLNQIGYRIHVVNTLGYNVSPIKKTVAVVGAYIQKNNLTDVILVSHSKGGLVAKCLLDTPRVGEQIRLSVSIATPYGGTWAGYFHIFSLAELIPGSQFLRTCMKQSSKNKKILNFFAERDNRISPNRHAQIAGGENILIHVNGHTRILESQELRRLLDRHIGYTTAL